MSDVSRRHPLAVARASLGLSLREVSKIIGIDFRRVHLFERGLQPTDRELALLAAFYRLPQAQLRDTLRQPPEPSSVAAIV